MFAHRDLGSLHSSYLHSALMLAALTIGHHFSISAFCWAASASGVCCSRGHVPWPISARRRRTPAGSSKASTNAALSLAMTSLGVLLGARGPGPGTEPSSRGEAHFVKCRRLRRRRPSGFGHHPIGLELPGAYLSQRACHLGKGQIDLAGNQILDHGCGAAVGPNESACRCSSGNTSRQHPLRRRRRRFPPSPCRDCPSARRSAPPSPLSATRLLR